MASIADVIKFTPTLGGLTDWILATAATGYRTPSGNLTNGSTYSYRAESADKSEWEVGTGAWTSATSTLARTTVLYSSTGAKVNFTVAPAVAIVALAGDVRERLTATRTYYVRTDGSDSNTGLADTSGGAFLTIQKAIDTVALLDIGTYAVTIQVGTGTYTAGASVVGPWLGTAAVTLQGDTTTPSNVVISTTSATCISVTQGGRLTVKGFKLTTTTSGSGLSAANNGVLTVNGSIEIGACATYQCTASNGGQINLNTNYTVSGGSNYHWIATSRGGISCVNRTVTLTGTPAFSGNFASASRISVIECHLDTFSGSATGSRYYIDGNAIIFTNAAGASYLPGDSAGSTTTGGQYV